MVDVTELESPKDMYTDDMGSRKYNGVYRAWDTVESDGFTNTHGNRKPCRSEKGTVYHIQSTLRCPYHLKPGCLRRMWF